MARGEAPSGDLIPWTLSQQFQESDFASLSGARIVRVAVHPDLQHMGYGSRAVDLLTHYYQGDLTDLAAAAAAKKAAKKAAKAAATAKGGGGGGGGGGSSDDDDDDGEGGSSSNLLTEEVGPRAELPPLLLSLAQRPPERLHWLGASFGLTQPLFRFWHRLGFLPVYVRQTVNETTGEHTAVTVRPLDDPDKSLPPATRVRWAAEYAHDFRRRLVMLLGMSLRGMPVDLALSLLDPELQPAAGGADANADADAAAKLAPSAEQLDFLLGAYDLRRLQSYAHNLVDHHLILDLVPLIAQLRFTNRLRTPLSHVQAALLLGVGLQAKSIDDLQRELGLPASQLLALFNKAMRKIVGMLRAVVERREAASLPHTAADADAAGSGLRPLVGDRGLESELDEGAKASLRKLQEDVAQKQATWVDGVEGGDELARYAIKGSDADWEAALNGGGRGGLKSHVSLPASARSSGGGGDESEPGKKRRKSEGGAPGSSGKKKRKDKS